MKLLLTALLLLASFNASATEDEQPCSNADVSRVSEAITSSNVRAGGEQAQAALQNILVQTHSLNCVKDFDIANPKDPKGRVEQYIIKKPDGTLYSITILSSSSTGREEVVLSEISQ